MPFKKGQSGNPMGRSLYKEWSSAVRLVVNRRAPDGRKIINHLADRLVDMGIEGDVAAIKEIGARLDGRPAQAVELGGKHGKPLLAFNLIYPPRTP